MSTPAAEAFTASLPAPSLPVSGLALSGRPSPLLPADHPVKGTQSAQFGAAPPGTAGDRSAAPKADIARRDHPVRHKA